MRPFQGGVGAITSIHPLHVLTDAVKYGNESTKTLIIYGRVETVTLKTPTHRGFLVSIGWGVDGTRVWDRGIWIGIPFVGMNYVLTSSRYLHE